MKLKYTILYVEDVTQSLEFYESAFGFNRKFLHEGGDYGELDTGDTILAFSSLELMTNLGKTPARASATAPTFEIALETADVKAALSQALAGGAVLIQDVEEKPWGQSTAYVGDINDFLIEICSPVGQ